MNNAVQNIVVAGKSGAGKQPRIDVLVAQFGLRQLSTGNIFREYLGAFSKVRADVKTAGLWSEAGFASDEAIRAALAPACAAKGVEVDSAVLGFKAAQYVDRGLFVPDEITNALFSATFRASQGKGLVLDGYPRTPEQSDFLLALVKELGTQLNLVLVVDNDDDAIVSRTVGRRICPNKACGKVYHVVHKPAALDGTCLACGTPVVQRSDDTEEKVKTRLAEFKTKAKPAIDRLIASGIPSATVPGNLPVFSDEAVTESVMSAIKPLL